MGPYRTVQPGYRLILCVPRFWRVFLCFLIEPNLVLTNTWFGIPRMCPFWSRRRSETEKTKHSRHNWFPWLWGYPCSVDVDVDSVIWCQHSNWWQQKCKFFKFHAGCCIQSTDYENKHDARCRICHRRQQALHFLRKVVRAMKFAKFDHKITWLCLFCSLSNVSP